MKIKLEIELDMEAYSQAYPDFDCPTKLGVMEMVRDCLGECFWDWKRGRNNANLDAVKITFLV